MTKFVGSPTALIACCMAALGAGCSEGDAPAGGATTRDTLSSGVEVVSFSPATEPRWTMVEELRVGSVGSGGPDQFGSISGLAVTADGGFAVLDFQAQEVRVFDAQGAHVATHGGRGGGPGELESANGLLMSPDGLLWVPDSRNLRMSVFNVHGGFVESHPYQRLDWSFQWPGAMGADGRIFEQHYDRNADPVERLLVVYDETMIALDTLPMGPYKREGFYSFTVGRASGSIGVPFFPMEMLLIDPAGSIWQTDAGLSEYRIRKWTPGGDTTFVVVGNRTVLPVADAERDSAIAHLQEQLGRVGIDADFDWSRIPDAKPVVDGLFLPGDGNLWVKTTDASGQTVFDMLSATDGSYQGTVLAGVPGLVVGPRLLHVRGDRIWFVTVDASAVPHVVRARLHDAR